MLGSRSVAVQGFGYGPRAVALDGWLLLATAKPSYAPAQRRAAAPVAPRINLDGSGAGGGGGIVGGWWMPDRAPRVIATSDGYEIHDRDEPFGADWRTGMPPREPAPFRWRPAVRNVAVNVTEATRVRVDDLLERLLNQQIDVGVASVVKSPGDAVQVLGDTETARLRIALVDLTLPSGDVHRVMAIAQEFGFVVAQAAPQRVRLLAPPEPDPSALPTGSWAETLKDWIVKRETRLKAKRLEAQVEAQATHLRIQAEQLAAQALRIEELEEAVISLPIGDAPSVGVPTTAIAIPERRPPSLRLMLLVAVPVLAVAALCLWLASRGARPHNK
jgi:hypothetical protein